MNNNIFVTRSAAIFLLALFSIVSCKDDDTDVRRNIEELKERVRKLEEATSAGYLIKSVTPIEDEYGGWRIEFTGGNPSIIDILNGTTNSNPDPGEGITPQLEVRESADGSSTLWVDYGEGWTDTEVDLTGPQGDPGEYGISPRIDVRKNADNTITVWYNITAGYPESGWEDTEFDISAVGPVLSIVNNSDGTVTITMNDGQETEFTFYRASTAVRFEIMTLETIEIEEGGTGEVSFVVNPSTAWIHLDDLSKWTINGIYTRQDSNTTADYVTPDDVFAVQSITGIDGMYTATIAAADNGYSTADNDEHIVAFVYNVGNMAEPVFISSGVFTLKVVQKQVATNSRITWNGTGYAITTDPTDAGLYFKFGSVVGIFSGNGANQTLPGSNTDTFDPGDVAWSPVTITNWTSVPVYADDPAPVDAAYHTAANVKAGKGDPCRLAGLDLAKIAETAAGSLTLTDIDNGTWRLPTAEENDTFAGYSVMKSTNDHWTTAGGIPGGIFPTVATGSEAAFLPAAGCRNFLGGEVRDQGNYGWYSTQSENVLVFLPDLIDNSMSYYALGYSIRCVHQ